MAGRENIPACRPHCHFTVHWLRAANQRNIPRPGPLRDILTGQRCGHQFRKLIWSTREHRTVHGGDLLRVVGVIAGMAVIGKRQEHNNIDSALLERCHSREHRLCVAALVQIGNQDQVSL